MDISLTENAVREVRRLIADQAGDAALCLRVSVVGGGCSGFKWKLELEPNEPSEKDVSLEQDGVTILTDNRSVLYVDGTLIDYSNDLNRRGFIFLNDRIRSTCGCGSSFSL